MYISDVDEVGPAEVVVTEADRPGRAADRLFLHTRAVKLAPVPPNLPVNNPIRVKFGFMLG